MILFKKLDIEGQNTGTTQTLLNHMMRIKIPCYLQEDDFHKWNRIEKVVNKVLNDNLELIKKTYPNLGEYYSEMIKNYAKESKHEKIQKVKYLDIITHEEHMKRLVAERPLLNDRHWGYF